MKEILFFTGSMFLNWFLNFTMFFLFDIDDINILTTLSFHGINILTTLKFWRHYSVTSRSPASLASSSWWPTSYLLFCWFYFSGNQTSTVSSLLLSISVLISISYLSFTLLWLMMKLNDQFLADALIKI
jgi:hypothetical protein